MEVEGDRPAGALLGVERGGGVLDARAGEPGRAESEGAALLVGEGQPGAGRAVRLVVGLGARLVVRLVVRLVLGLGAGALDGVEAELGGSADDFGGLARVLDVGEFDDDPVLAGAGQGGFGDAEGVDALAKHFKGAVGALAVRFRGVGVLGLEHHSGAALQVEAESG